MLCCFRAGSQESGIESWKSGLRSGLPPNRNVRQAGRNAQGNADTYAMLRDLRLSRFPIPDSRFPAPARGARR